MDFVQIVRREAKNGRVEITPDFVVGRSKDLMIRGKSFYAIWDEEAGLWSTDEYDVQRLVDLELAKHEGPDVSIKYMRSYKNNGWNDFKRFISQLSDNSHQLDAKLTFANDKVTKRDYVSKRLPYSLVEGPCDAWDELVGTLYSPEERRKIEWSIGAVVSGDSKKIQKFVVLHGLAGTGKSTIFNVIEDLFQGYTTYFEAKALGSNNGAFAMEPFRSNPLVGIQHDGDLSRIEDNTRLNSIIAHEAMTMNEKYKPSYSTSVMAFLYMGTNLPVKISDAKSGMIRRLIDITPTGILLPPKKYNALVAQTKFELGAIAQRCFTVYQELGRTYYNGYRPLSMMYKTDVFFNFVEAHWDIFTSQNGISLKQAYALYRTYCDETGIDKQRLPQYRMREELRNYFDEFHERITLDGETYRSYYTGFKRNVIETGERRMVLAAEPNALSFTEEKSLLDEILADCPAQYAKTDGTPSKYWDSKPRIINGELKTPDKAFVVYDTLSGISTSELHYVKPPKNLVVIDFDLKDKNGQKCARRNIEESSKWPPTYGEISAGGNGVHLHYYWDGDTSLLRRDYSDGIEVKVFSGNAALRRRVFKCNALPIATINTGLPLKEKRVLSIDRIQSERGLRDLIRRNLEKSIHPGTKPSIDFIEHILDEAYSSGIPYDVTDLRSAIIVFANSSTNHAIECLRTAMRMKFKSEDNHETSPKAHEKPADERLVFVDVEVYPNLFVVCWKYQGDSDVVAMINPTATDVESLFKMRLVGFNIRRYDNHMLYACYLGYTVEQLYQLSKRIIDGDQSGLFGEAFGLSYADVYDFSSKKQSLKKFQIDLGIRHLEMSLPWDQPIKKEDIPKIVEYCKNDVTSTEAVFESRKQDFVAREILAELSGLTVNDTTAKHTATIIFGADKRPQRSFNYTKLSKKFDGYVYDRGRSTYRNEVVGEGGYVYAEPGIHYDVALLDVASMHPTSIILLELFGKEYTRNFAELVYARLAIKHGDYKKAASLLGGKLKQFISEKEDDAKALAYALKIIINIVYGLTSAKFDNPFRDLRNVDNIVAKHGALFMIDLKRAIQEQGFTVAHIKTDSVKIPNATPEIIKFVIAFGAKYGYTFEHEATYDRLCLVNDAVYVARNHDEWTTVGAQFQHPYVYKSLFSGEQITFDDLCEAKSVMQGSMYMDFDYDKPINGPEDLERMRFVGRSGLFVPVCEGFNGARLYRVKEGKHYAVSGTKGYVWVEAEMARGPSNEAIDYTYFEDLCKAARRQIEKYGSFEEFVETTAN